MGDCRKYVPCLSSGSMLLKAASSPPFSKVQRAETSIRVMWSWRTLLELPQPWLMFGKKSIYPKLKDRTWFSLAQTENLEVCSSSKDRENLLLQILNSELSADFLEKKKIPTWQCFASYAVLTSNTSILSDLPYLQNYSECGQQSAINGCAHGKVYVKNLIQYCMKYSKTLHVVWWRNNI